MKKDTFSFWKNVLAIILLSKIFDSYPQTRYNWLLKIKTTCATLNQLASAFPVRDFWDKYWHGGVCFQFLTQLIFKVFFYFHLFSLIFINFFSSLSIISFIICEMANFSSIYFQIFTSTKNVWFQFSLVLFYNSLHKVCYKLSMPF